MTDDRKTETGEQYGWKEPVDPGDAERTRRYSAIAEQVMKRQAALGLRVAALFVVMIVGLPLFNYYWPRTAATPVFGFTLTWLFLGIGFFPITWLLSAYFVRESDRIEAEAARSPMVTTVSGVATGPAATPADREEDAQ